MNMHVEVVEDRAPTTVLARLREYSRCRHWESPNTWPPESPLFAVLHAPGRATNGAQDGGMAARIDRIGRAIAIRSRVIEIGSAIAILPPDMLQIIRLVYEVPVREEPKSERDVADMMGIGRVEAARRLERAYGYLARHLCLDVV